MGRTRMVFVTILVLCSFIFNGYADSQPELDVPGLTIGEIKTAGNRIVSNAQIVSKLRSREGQMFDSVTADEDAKRIAELNGVDYCYYNTVIVDNKIQLTFVVVEQNLVRSIKFIGNKKYKSGKLKKKLDFKLADYLDLIKAQEGVKNIVEFYKKKGFAFAVVSLDRYRLDEGAVVYRITEGPRVKVQSVKFAGNTALKTKNLKNKTL